MTSTPSGAGSAGDAEPLLAITLVSSNTPVEMPTLTDERLRGLALFKSRRREEGRERFRLHLGYFLTVLEAERVLAYVRPNWPRAMIAAVPQVNLGSLDNTALTHFTIVEPARPLEAAAEAPPILTTNVTVLPEVPRPAAEMAPPIRPANLAPAVAAPTAAAPRPAAPPAAPIPITAGAKVEEGSVAGVEAPRPGPQRYAVQLVFGREPIDLASLPELAIYEGYLLYAIETQPGGRRHYGVRLGFYDDVLSARLVAQYVRSEFHGVVIVPVSEREVARAMDARIGLQAVRTARGRTGTALPTWPRTALTVSFEPRSHLPLAT